MIGFSPLSEVSAEKNEGGLGKCYTRNFAYRALFFVAFAIPLLLSMVFLSVVNFDLALTLQQAKWVFIDSVSNIWYVIFALPVFVRTLKFLFIRYCSTWVSSFLRDRRLAVSGDKPSDIRDVIAQIQAKKYIPEDYFDFKKGMFLGLDIANKPIYLSFEEYYDLHSQYVGPTRSGKDTGIGVVMAQHIALGNCLFYIDPKHDKWAPHLLREQAEKHGRRFLYLDLNSKGIGSYSPFENGTSRERRSRFFMACGLEESGEESDCYKLTERGGVNCIWEKSGSTVKGLLHELENLKGSHDTIRAIESLREISEIPTFIPPRNSRFPNIDQMLKESVVVYVKGALKDHVVIKMSKVFVLELMQRIISLEEEGKRNKPVYTVLNELRFYASNEVGDMLSTIGGYNATVAVAYQSLKDPEHVNKGINGESLRHSIDTNCQLKFLHRMNDPEVAERIAGMTGIAQRTFTRSEDTEVGNNLEETWTGRRTIHKKDEAFVHQNVVMSMPPLVGVFIKPGALADIYFTSQSDNTNNTFEIPSMLLTNSPGQSIQEKEK